MRIFEIKTDINNVQSLNLSDYNSNRNILDFKCKSKIREWTQPLLVYIWDPATDPQNFYSMPSGILVFDEYVLEICRTAFEIAGEILSIKVEQGNNLYLLNVLNCRNGLNYETTKWDYYSDGTRGRILKLGFHPERVLEESSIFKIPEVISTRIFCYADVKNPDDEFYHIYHKHKLTGLIFEEVYNDGKS